RLRQFEDEVDNLFLEDRGTQIVNRLWALAIKFDHLTLIAGVTPRFLGERLVELLLGDGNVVAAAGFGEQQPEANPPLGDAAVFLLERYFILVGRRGLGVRGAFQRGFLGRNDRGSVDRLLGRSRMRGRVVRRRLVFVDLRLRRLGS